MRAIFNKKIKYRGVYYPARCEFDIDELDEQEMIDGGGVITEGQPGGNEETDQSLVKLTVTQLKVYAEENGIDLGDATKKTDMLALIEAAAID